MDSEAAMEVFFFLLFFFSFSHKLLAAMRVINMWY